VIPDSLADDQISDQQVAAVQSIAREFGDAVLKSPIAQEIMSLPTVALLQTSLVASSPASPGVPNRVLQFTPIQPPLPTSPQAGAQQPQTPPQSAAQPTPPVSPISGPLLTPPASPQAGSQSPLQGSPQAGSQQGPSDPFGQSAADALLNSIPGPSLGSSSFTKGTLVSPVVNPGKQGATAKFKAVLSDIKGAKQQKEADAAARALSSSLAAQPPAQASTSSSLPPDGSQPVVPPTSSDLRVEAQQAQFEADEELMSGVIDAYNDILDRFQQSVHNEQAANNTFGSEHGAEKVCTDVEEAAVNMANEYRDNVNGKVFRRRAKDADGALRMYNDSLRQLSKYAHIVDVVPGTSADKRIASQKIQEFMEAAINGQVVDTRLVPPPQLQNSPESRSLSPHPPTASPSQSQDPSQPPPPPPQTMALPIVPEGDDYEFKDNIGVTNYRNTTFDPDPNSYYNLLSQAAHILEIDIKSKFFTKEYNDDPARSNVAAKIRESAEKKVVNMIREAATNFVQLPPASLKVGRLRTILSDNAAFGNVYLRAYPTQVGLLSLVLTHTLKTAPVGANDDSLDESQSQGADAFSTPHVTPQRSRSASRKSSSRSSSKSSSRSASNASEDKKDEGDDQATQEAIKGRGVRKRKAPHVTKHTLKGYGMETEMVQPPTATAPMPPKQVLAVLGQQDLPIYDRANMPNFSVSNSNMYVRRAYHPNQQLPGTMTVRHNVQLGDVDDYDTRFNAKRKVRPAPGWLCIDDGPASKMARRHF
jgi:hypothetical protein